MDARQTADLDRAARLAQEPAEPDIVLHPGLMTFAQAETPFAHGNREGQTSYRYRPVAGR